jgi:hypothetical protein
MMDDVYSSPEKFGLTTIAQLDDDLANYSFDMVVAWKHSDGSIYWGQDSGCSCPSPFEEFTGLEMLSRAAPDLLDLQQAVENHHTHSAEDARRFMEAVRSERQHIQPLGVSTK